MSIHLDVDPSNPGQFFACCGLLELADRLWGGAEGAFSPSGVDFSLSCFRDITEGDADELRAKLASCEISSTMADKEISRLKKLLNQDKKSLTSNDEDGKRRLSELWNRERLYLHKPFDLWIDWWGDERAGGSSFKTWAGKQFVIDLVRGMQTSIRSWSSVPVAKWLNEPASDRSLPLYFDADIGGQSSSRDVGFSTDALGMRSRTRPLIEFAAFVGLQRFRPLREEQGGWCSYVLWTNALPPISAAAACCGKLPQPGARTFEFRLLYRSKYLKSFLTANPRRLAR